MLIVQMYRQLQIINLQIYNPALMIADQTIEFKFPTVRSKLQNLFPFDPKYDLQILYKNNKYELQSAYLRLESGFFKSVNPNASKVLKIEESFNEDYFQQIMKCFYGGIFKCPRASIFQAWHIFQFLKIQSFKKQTIKDMKQNFDKYNFFELMTFGFMNNVQEIFNNCLLLLDGQNFVQLKKNKDQFLVCPLEVFKFLINTHNRRSKAKRALNFIEINSMLCEYKEKHDYSEEFYNDLKFQLIQKTQLSAEQYRLIFIEGAKTQSSKQIPQISFSKKGSGTKISSTDPYLAESAKMLSNKSVTPQEKQHWQEKLQALKQNCQSSQSDFKLLQSSVDNLTKSLKKKTQQGKIKEKSITKMEILIRQIEKEIREKNESLKKISQRVQKLENSNSKGGKTKASRELPQQEQETDEFVETMIIPGFVLGQFIEGQNTKKQAPLPNSLKPQTSAYEPTASTANFSKKKKNAVVDPSQQKQTQQNYFYKNCLLFDKEPISIPRRYLDTLAKIMETDEFVKKKQLSLIFRRSKTSNQNIGDPSTIKNRQALLVVFETSYKKFVGGYISVEIPSFTKSDSLCDYQAFIFSLTHNVKIPIMKGQQKSAISLSKHYLLSFGNDLMISNDCLNEGSYCEWPVIYQVPKNSKCTSAKDLVGSNGQFKIEQIDIYEAKNEQIEMVL